MIKRYYRNISLIAFIAILLSIFGQTSFATNQPSSWAEPEIYAAIEKKLVPSVLQGNYQTNIKRYEYVLIALEVFNLSGKTVEIADSNPFKDTENHPYEADIIKAYNAGIIKGDGKGNFFPDNNITRQEIASLVVNLLNQISPDRDFTLKGTYQYADSAQLSDWAVYYVDYCFENGILNGYGGNVMDPLGNATIEQSIALLYRLANTEHLLESVYGTLILSDISLEDNTPSVQIVNQFVDCYGIETFNVLKELSNNQNIGIISLWESSTVVAVGDNTISLNNNDFEKNIFALVHNATDDLLSTAFRQLLTTYDRHLEPLQLFDEYILKMKTNEEINISVQINDTDSFNIETLGESDERLVYKLYFIQNKEIVQ